MHRFRGLPSLRNRQPRDPQAEGVAPRPETIAHRAAHPGADPDLPVIRLQYRKFNPPVMPPGRTEVRGAREAPPAHCA